MFNILTFTLAHLGAAVVLNDVLKAFGVNVFSSDESQGLIDTSQYRSATVEYAVLLDYLSKTLLVRASSFESYDDWFNGFKAWVTEFVKAQRGENEVEEITLTLEEMPLSVYTTEERAIDYEKSA